MLNYRKSLLQFPALLRFRDMEKPITFDNFSKHLSKNLKCEITRKSVYETQLCSRQAKRMAILTHKPGSHHHHGIHFSSTCSFSDTVQTLSLNLKNLECNPLQFRTGGIQGNSCNENRIPVQQISNIRYHFVPHKVAQISLGLASFQTQSKHCHWILKPGLQSLAG